MSNMTFNLTDTHTLRGKEAKVLEETKTEMRVEMVHPDTLKFAPFNPPIRTTSKSVIGLKAEIEKAGKIISPIIITYENYVADGHRRLTVAKELGYEKVPVIREDFDLADLWSILNGGNRPASAGDWMQAVRGGFPLDAVPDKRRIPLEDLIRVMGRKEFEKITDEGRKPSIIIIAQYVAKYCGDTSDKFVRKVVNWLRYTPNVVRNAKAAVSGHCPAEIIIDAIDEGKSLSQSWGLH